jgi:hypothetical protein
MSHLLLIPMRNPRSGVCLRWGKVHNAVKLRANAGSVSEGFDLSPAIRLKFESPQEKRRGSGIAFNRRVPRLLCGMF